MSWQGAELPRAELACVELAGPELAGLSWLGCLHTAAQRAAPHICCPLPLPWQPTPCLAGYAASPGPGPILLLSSGCKACCRRPGAAQLRLPTLECRHLYRGLLPQLWLLRVPNKAEPALFKWHPSSSSSSPFPFQSTPSLSMDFVQKPGTDS